jgi:hypothetical protein
VGVGLALWLGDGVRLGVGEVCRGVGLAGRDGLGLGVLDGLGSVGDGWRDRCGGDGRSKDGGSSDGATTTRTAWCLRCVGDAAGNRGAGLAANAWAIAAGSPGTLSPVTICQPAMPITPSVTTAPVAARATPIFSRRPVPRRARSPGKRHGHPRRWVPVHGACAACDEHGKRDAGAGWRWKFGVCWKSW